jgi:hypothetical protein
MKMLNKKSLIKPRGQSFIELALVMLSLPILFVGVVELGLYLNVYLDVIDAAREAARNANSYELYRIDEITHEEKIGNLVFNEAAKVAWNTMNPGCQGYLKDKDVELIPVLTCENMRIPFTPGNGFDDIVISVISYNGVSYERIPKDNGYFTRFDVVHDELLNPHSGLVNIDELGLDPAALPTGMILVEIFYNHYQLLGVPLISNYILNPIPMHTYSIMPYPAGDPTPSP